MSNYKALRRGAVRFLARAPFAHPVPARSHVTHSARPHVTHSARPFQCPFPTRTHAPGRMPVRGTEHESTPRSGSSKQGGGTRARGHQVPCSPMSESTE
eukprot:932928-Rhodomonas_salina.1